MSDDDLDLPPSENLAKRILALEAVLVDAKKLVSVGDLKWDDVMSDLRLLAVNHILRRQLESLDAALALAKMGLGHLAVSFVRPALEEMIWLKYLTDLSEEDANKIKILLAMGKNDALRSLMAQRDYVGAETMQDLWYTDSWLNGKEATLTKVKEELKDLSAEFGWDRKSGPTMQWLAEKTDEVELYKYLHAASSRAIHFSAGEIMRRGWGAPGGIMTTGPEEFRAHLSNFALYELLELFLQTATSSDQLLEDAGISSEIPDAESQILITAGTLGELGRVPLVHAAEWNLTPEDPVPKLIDQIRVCSALRNWPRERSEDLSSDSD